MRRMTPAKLWVLMAKGLDKLAFQEQPLAQIACMFYNANRSTGDKEKGIAPAPAKMPDEFLVFSSHKRKKGKSLAAKDKPGGRHNLDGAQTDRGDWEAWLHGKSKPVVHRR